MKKKFTMLMALALCVFTSSVMAQTYAPGSRTTTLEAGKQYFISVATYYNSACTNLLYNNGGTLAKSDLLPGSITDDAAYLFTVEEVGDGYLAYIKNSDGKYLQADALASTETKTGVYVIPYFDAKAVCCGDDVDACDESGNRIAYANITAETPIVSVQKNSEYTVADNRNGWRYINGLSAGVNWCTAFAFYEVVDGDAALTEAKASVNDKIEVAEALLTTAGFSFVGGDVALQTENANAAAYLSSNADQNTGGGSADGEGIAGLIDGKIDDSYYFHTRWSGSNPGEAHYIQVDLGEGEALKDFVFNYTTRKAAWGAGYTSPAPTIIEIYGGNDVNSITNLIATVKSTDEVNPLPLYSELGKNWNSGTISANEAYRYLRFVVTESAGPGGAKFGDYYMFCMAEFGLSIPQALTTTNDAYKSRERILYALSQAVANAKDAVSGSDITVINDASAAIDTYMARVNLTYPFDLTTDDENPVVYAIKSGRGDAYWYTYDSSDGMISLSEYTAAQTQLWYFKEVVTDDYKCALQLFPYLGEGKAMSYEDTNSAAEKIVAKDLNTSGWQNYWVLAATNGDAPYGLQTFDGNNYLSNYGGTGNKMGMWNAAPNADGGTAMYFVSPAQVLQDLIDVAKSYKTEAAVGYITSTSHDALQIAITAAETAHANKNYSTADLQAAIAALETVQPEEGKFYVIKSAVPESDGRSGKKIYVNNNGGMNFENATTMAHVFQFVDAGGNTFYLKSVDRGTYLSTNKAHNYGQQEAKASTIDDAKALAIANMGRENVVSLIPVGGAMIHAQAANSSVVAWNNTENTSASAWVIEEVSLDEIAHSVTISAAAQWSTLVLGYNATVPAGVKAYAVTATGSNYVTLAEVTGTIPAGEAVLLNVEGITENTTYDFKYAESATAVEGNLLVGTTLNANIEEANAYVLSMPTIDEVVRPVGLYKAALNISTDTSNDGTTEEPAVTYEAFLNNAFKAYLVVEEGAAAPAMFSFSRGGDEDTTGIESTLNSQPSAVIYDLAGRRVEKMEKGIYIVNGKKVIK